MSTLIKKVFFSANKDTGTLNDLIQQALAIEAKSLMILACDGNAVTAAQIDPLLQALSIPVCGGIFPTVLHDKQHHDLGYLVCAFNDTFQVHELEDMSADMTHEMQTVMSSNNIAKNSMFVLLDGLNQHIDSFINKLYDCVGPSVNVLGGGAGSLSFEQKPCIISNQGLLMNCAQIVLLPKLINVGVRHGWEILAGPYMVTESKGNTICSLNYAPAYEVYKEIVAPHTDLDFDNSDFFDIAKTFPFGMERLDGEVLVRDPIMVTEDGLLCVGKVPLYTMIYILQGAPEQLINAAASGVNVSGEELTLQPDAFVFDCVSRKLFLGDLFDEELSSIRQQLPEKASLVGVLSLGEIANGDGGMIQFHNKTTVIGICP